MKLLGLTVLGRRLELSLAKVDEQTERAETPTHFTGYEYKCYLCGEMLVRRENPLTDSDLDLLCRLHVCEENR